MEKPIILARNIHKTFRNGKIEVHALRGVDLSIASGEMVAVMGPSGCGKTTLINCLSGLDSFDTGEVEIEGASLRAMSDRARTSYRARRMGFVFQTFNLLPVITAVENVELPLLLSGVRPREARQRALRGLTQVGLADRAEHRPAELSGGERQRVTIARALASRPAIVWADEPTGNLDTMSATDVLTLMRDLNREQGQTFVIVTHDPKIGDLCDRVIRMQDGAIVADVRDEAPPIGRDSRSPHRDVRRRGGRGIGATMTTQPGFFSAQTWAIGLLAAVALVLLTLVVMGLRNRTIAKLGLRNIPRRRSQSALIILGLTLSTIIIVSALSIGDTLSYSVRRHAINAYGTIDQVISPPLLSALAGLATNAAEGDNPADALAGSELSGLLEGDLLSILGLLQEGLPGISEERYAQLRDQAQADPATAAVVDGLAPSIAFPTIIRDRTSGQGIPLGFIVAVNNEYDEQFGLTTVDGEPVQMEDLRTGVGNIFAQASNLFRWADSIGINVDSVAAGIAQAGALITQGQGLLNEATGEPTRARD